MKYRHLFMGVLLAVSWSSLSSAAMIGFEDSNVKWTNRQPVQVIIVDPNGRQWEQTVEYDPSIGGVDLTGTWVGPNASVYFPSLGSSYLFYNGYWVDQSGYYWRDGQRAYIGSPYWNEHWNNYWSAHPHRDWQGGVPNRNWDRQQWNGERGNWNREWNGERGNWNREWNGQRGNWNREWNSERKEGNREWNGERGGMNREWNNGQRWDGRGQTWSGEEHERWRNSSQEREHLQEHDHRGGDRQEGGRSGGGDHHRR